MAAAARVTPDGTESQREETETDAESVASSHATMRQLLEEDFPSGDIFAPRREESRSDEVVRLRNVHKTYLLGLEGVAALRGVSLTIRRGEFVVILGKSGCGKTSLLSIIGTIDRPTRGDVFLGTRRVDSRTSDAELARIRLRYLGFVFQTFNLLPSMTAVENVELPMVLTGQGDAATRRERALDLLKQVGMSGRATHVPSQLSGGEQQRVTVARALANHPQLLLLDEPTGDLDAANSEIVMKLLTDLNAAGSTLVMVTHDRALKSYAHKVVHMLDGKITRVEPIPSSEREEALRALRERPAVVALETGAVDLRVPPSPATASLGPTSVAAPIPRRVLRVRQPRDYATLRFATAFREAARGSEEVPAQGLPRRPSDVRTSFVPMRT